MPTALRRNDLDLNSPSYYETVNVRQKLNKKKKTKTGRLMEFFGPYFSPILTL